VNETSAWRMAWESSDLAARHRRVLCALACSMGGDGGRTTNCSPSTHTIGRRSGYAARTVTRYVGELEDLGWVAVSRFPGQRSRYYAHVPGEGRDPREKTEPKADPKSCPHHPWEERYRDKRRGWQCTACKEEDYWGWARGSKPSREEDGTRPD
jgi:DNA-binding MarR family transcriptional regulator